MDGALQSCFFMVVMLGGSLGGEKRGVSKDDQSYVVSTCSGLVHAEKFNGEGHRYPQYFC